MKRPSRGDRESAATIRYCGCLVLPTRVRRSFTAMESPSEGVATTNGEGYRPKPRVRRLPVGRVGAGDLGAVSATAQSGRNLCQGLSELAPSSHRTRVLALR